MKIMTTKKVTLGDLVMDQRGEFSFSYFVRRNGMPIWMKVYVCRLSRGYEVMAKIEGAEFPFLKRRARKSDTLNGLYSEIENVFHNN